MEKTERNLAIVFKKDPEKVSCDITLLLCLIQVLSIFMASMQRTYLIFCLWKHRAVASLIEFELKHTSLFTKGTHGSRLEYLLSRRKPI